jgi:dynein heavy chain
VVCGAPPARPPPAAPQAQACEYLGAYLRDAWSAAIKSAVRGSLAGAGKGWAALGESSWGTYKAGKMRRLLTVVRLAMEDSVRCAAGGGGREVVG